MNQAQKSELAMKVQRTLKQLEYQVPLEKFEQVWRDLDQNYLDRMSANELAKTVFFRSVAQDQDTNYALTYKKYTNLPGDKEDVARIMRRQAEIKKAMYE
jgi:hypothetical protein